MLFCNHRFDGLGSSLRSRGHGDQRSGCGEYLQSKSPLLKQLLGSCGALQVPHLSVQDVHILKCETITHEAVEQNGKERTQKAADVGLATAPYESNSFKAFPAKGSIRPLHP